MLKLYPNIYDVYVKELLPLIEHEEDEYDIAALISSAVDVADSDGRMMFYCNLFDTADVNDVLSAARKGL